MPEDKEKDVQFVEKNKRVDMYYVMPESLARLIKTILIIAFIIFIIVMIEFHIILWKLLSIHLPSGLIDVLTKIANNMC